MLKSFLIIWVSNMIVYFLAFKQGYRKGERDRSVYNAWLLSKYACKNDEIKEE